MRLPETLRHPNGVVGVHGSGAPPLPRRADGGAIPAGQHRQPPVGDGETAAALHGGFQRQFQGGQPPDDLRKPRPLQPYQRAQVGGGEPGPVGDQVEGALLDGTEHCGQRPVLPCLRVEDFGQGRPRQGFFVGPGASRPGVVEDGAKIDEGGPGGRAPDGRSRARGGGVPLQDEVGDERRSRQKPAGVAQPHLVGHQQEHGGGLRPLPEPPEPLGEAGAVGGRSLPYDGDYAPVGEGYGGVHRHGAVPPEAEGVGQGRYGGDEAVDDGYAVQPLHQNAPPLVRDRSAAEKLIQVPVLLAGQPPQPVCGQAVAASRRRQLRGVGHGGRQPLAFEALDGLVDRSPRPAGDGDGLQPVDERHVGE